LAMHIAAKIARPQGGTIHVGVDSTASIATYEAIQRLTPQKRLKLSNMDLWNLIIDYKNTWGTLHLYHVPSHMDDYFPLHELKPEWRGNCLADVEADKGYSEGSEVTHRQLARYCPLMIWYSPSDEEPEPVLVNFAPWARKMVRHHLSHQYLSTHPLMDDVDWKATTDYRKVSSTYYDRLKLMKLMWHLYAFGHIKLFRQHCSAKDALCTWCGLHAETMNHVLLECRNPKLQEHRQKLFLQLTGLISDQVDKESTKLWLKDAIPHIWGKSDTEIAATLNVRLTVLQDKIKAWDPADLWKGVIPKRLISLLDALKIPKKELQLLARDITRATEHAAVDLWIATNEKKESLPDTSVLPSRREKAEALLLRPGFGYTLKEFLRLPPSHQDNILRKRTKGILGPDHQDDLFLPVGTELRLYDSPHLPPKTVTITTIVSGHAQPYITAQGGILGGLKRFTSEEALLQAVAKDNLTNYEKGMVSRALFPNKVKHYSLRKHGNPKGMAASVLAVSREPSPSGGVTMCSVIHHDATITSEPIQRVQSNYDNRAIIKSRLRRNTSYWTNRKRAANSLPSTDPSKKPVQTSTSGTEVATQSNVTNNIAVTTPTKNRGGEKTSKIRRSEKIQRKKAAKTCTSRGRVRVSDAGHEGPEPREGRPR
jgi:hypothetical protein